MSVRSTLTDGGRNRLVVAPGVAETIVQLAVHLAMSPLNFRRGPVDNPGVDQVSRPMQIALVAIVLLAGMWFTVLKPKPADDSAPAAAATPAATPAASSAPVAPGVKGLATAVDKAKAASATSDATNAKIQSASGGDAAAAAAAPTLAAKPAASATKTAAKKSTAAKSATKAKATKPAAAKPGTKAATIKATASTPAAAATSTPTKAAAATPQTDVDPSNRLLAFLKQGKVLVILFEGKGADDKAARTAVHRTAKTDPKHVVSAYVPIADVGKYEAITSDVQILAAPTILVIGTDGKATPLTGYVDAAVVRQTVDDARRAAAAAKK